MYIGPWQEYNLSKTRRSNNSHANNAANNTTLRHLAASLQQTIPAEQLKHGLEDALLHTLDPATAQAALQVMENYFQQQQSASTANVMLASTAGTALNSTLPPIHHYTVINNNHGDIITTTTTSIGGDPTLSGSSRRYQQYQQKSTNNRGKGKGGSNQTKLSLPPLPQQAAAQGLGGGIIYQAPHRHSARDRVHTPDHSNYQQHTKSPLSVRSTKSEPLKLPSLAVNAVNAPLNTYAGAGYYSSGAYSVGGAGNTHANAHANAKLLQGTGHFILPLTEKNLTHAQEQMQYGSEDNVNLQSTQKSMQRTMQQLNVPSSSGSGGSNGPRRPKQPLYDSNAVVNFLRMDRNNQKAKQHINQLTGWNKQGDTDSKKSGGSSSKADKALLESKEKKIEQVNQMKELYLSQKHAADQEAERQRLIAKVGIAALEMQKSPQGKKPPLESLSPIHSPRVNDIEITEEQLLQISKYFKQLSNANPPQGSKGSDAAVTSKATITSTSLGAGSPSTTSAMALSPRRKATRNIALDDEIEEDIPPPSYAQTQAQTRTQPVAARHAVVEEDDDLDEVDDDLDLSQFRYVPPTDGYSNTKQNAYDVGAADSLLNWSKQLNFDDF